jgi:protein-ribulosamine 3-kinase
MNPDHEHLVAHALHERVLVLRPLSSGTTSDVCLAELHDGRRLVAKFAQPGLLQEEVEGLDALRSTNTVRVPEVHSLHIEHAGAVLLMEELPVGGDADWADFGRTLAALHQAPAGERYGFTCDNHLGKTPQVNRWMDDWPRFNREQRHGPLVEGLVAGGGLAGPDLELVRRTLASFEAVLPRRPTPSLLHGDLWSGNALALVGGGVGVFDPVPSIGDALADIAMMQLFGGFPQDCFQGYQEGGGEALEPLRLAVYRLHHLLNHQRIFGEGYRSGVLKECRLILGEGGRGGLARC